MGTFDARRVLFQIFEAPDPAAEPDAHDAALAAYDAARASRPHFEALAVLLDRTAPAEAARVRAMANRTRAVD